MKMIKIKKKYSIIFSLFLSFVNLPKCIVARRAPKLKPVEYSNVCEARNNILFAFFSNLHLKVDTDY